MKSKFIPNYRKIADTLRRRIWQGNYALRPVPSERILAREFDSNYMTVRRSLKILENDGLLIRGTNKRLHIRLVRQGGKKHLNLAFLTPDPAAHGSGMWQRALEKAAASRSCSVRVIHYLDWEDPVLTDSLVGVDGIFLKPASAPPPDKILGLLRDSKHSVVVGSDFSAYGIPSIRSFPPVSVHRLLNHLKSLGHSRIGCINTQVTSAEARECSDQWHLWMGLERFSGRLIDRNMPAFENSAIYTYKVMKELILKSSLVESAWFCANVPMALGAMRAFLDCGFVPGEDVAVCAANSEGLENISNPRLTLVECADAVPSIALSLAWMSKGDQCWEGTLLMQPAEVPLTIHESTRRTEPVNVRHLAYAAAINRELRPCGNFPSLTPVL